MIGYCARVADSVIVRNSGFDYLEIKATDLPDQTDRQSFPILAINNIVPRSVDLFGDKDTTDNVLTLLDELFASSARIGIDRATLGSGRSRKIAGAEATLSESSRFISFLRGVDLLAAKHKIAVGLEPLTRDETNFINTISEARFWLDEAGCASIGITADSHHFFSVSDDLVDLEASADRILHIHIAGIEGRVSPRRLSAALKTFIGAIAKTPLDRKISVETDWRLSADPHSTLVEDLHELGF